MFGKLFGGVTVQLVEHQSGRLVFRSKSDLTIGQTMSLKVAGQNGKPAKIKAAVTGSRVLEDGGILCTASVEDTSHQRELSRLNAYSAGPGSGIRRSPRVLRRLNVDCIDFMATSVDISSGGIQLQTTEVLRAGQMLNLKLSPGLGCQARVAWIRGDKAGLEFWEVDEATGLLMSRFVSGRAIPTAIKPVPSPKSRLALITPPSYD